MASSKGNGQWVVMIDPPIPGVHHTAFGPFSEEGARNFHDSIGRNYPHLLIVAQEMASQVLGEPLSRRWREES